MSISKNVKDVSYISTYKQDMKVIYSWASIHRHLARMINDIQQDTPDFGHHPDDYIVTFPRGGFPISVILSHVLHDVKILTMEEFVKLAVFQKKKFHQILVVDEISDSGTTIRDAINLITHLLSNTSIWSEDRVPPLKTATLCVRAGTRYIPNYYRTVILSNAWVVFPWEVLNPTLRKSWFQKVLEFFSQEKKVVI